ncbi:hypothetical protein DFH06DRAFT_662880 [Mycena polygramma]|nr:hypothetical protein DFH06DRAFT_662880 [Mycena polygramma]
MLLSEETVDSHALLGTLPNLHVFVEVPTLYHSRGRIAEPGIYWSTHPTERDTSQLPTGTFQLRFRWGVSITTLGWEKHHYDVAKSLQEEYGFDPTTTAAAKALGLPILEACCDPTPSDGVFTAIS